MSKIENNNAAAPETPVKVETAPETVTAQAPEATTPEAPKPVEIRIDLLGDVKAATSAATAELVDRMNKIQAKSIGEMAGTIVGCFIVAAVIGGLVLAGAVMAADAKVTRAEKALEVARAQAGVKPTWGQHLYGTVVQPVADGASWTYETTKNADGKTYGVITSPFRTSPGTVEVKVSAPSVK